MGAQAVAVLPTAATATVSVTAQPGHPHGHGGQPDQGIRGGIAHVHGELRCFVNGGDTWASLTTLPTIITNATVASHVGTYSITASGAVDPNYAIGYTGGILSITAGPLGSRRITHSRFRSGAADANLHSLGVSKRRYADDRAQPINHGQRQERRR